MQEVGGALQGGSTIPRRSRLQVLLAILAILVIAAMVALVVLLSTLSTPDAGKVVPNDTGIMHASMVNPEAGSEIIHDEAGNVHREAGTAAIHDDAGNVYPD